MWSLHRENTAEPGDAGVLVVVATAGRAARRVRAPGEHPEGSLRAGDGVALTAPGLVRVTGGSDEGVDQGCRVGHRRWRLGGGGSGLRWGRQRRDRKNRRDARGGGREKMAREAETVHGTSHRWMLNGRGQGLTTHLSTDTVPGTDRACTCARWEETRQYAHKPSSRSVVSMKWPHVPYPARERVTAGDPIGGGRPCVKPLTSPMTAVAGRAFRGWAAACLATTRFEPVSTTR